MASFEKKITEVREVFCDGDSSDPELGHPGIYIIIPEGQNSIACSYCSKEFILSETK